MKIFLKEIKEEESTYSFSEKHDWVLAIVQAADENDDETTERQKFRPANLPPSQPATRNRPRDIEVEFRLRASNSVYYVSGRIEADINLLCSRCATTFKHEASGKFKTLFSENEKLGEASNLKNVTFNIEDLEDLEQFDDEITILKEKFLNLSAILNEQLQLLVPFQPLCKADCLGICQQCGTNLNDGKCACKKIVKESPFSVLKDMESKQTKTTSKKERS